MKIYSDYYKIELFREKKHKLKKKDVLQSRNGNSMANENCKHKGFFFFLRYFGPCIAGKMLLNNHHYLCT